MLGLGILGFQPIQEPLVVISGLKQAVIDECLTDKSIAYRL
jgi:hypothetical protein